MGAGQRIIEVVLYGVVAEAIFFILNETVGAAMDALESSFQSYLTSPGIKMSASWITIGQTSATNFHYFYDAIWVMGLMVLIWMVKSAIIQNPYSRQTG